MSSINKLQRSNNRKHNELRKITFTRNYTKYSAGSVLIEFGNTKVICTASISTALPVFLKNKNQGWLTAEYNMLPSATHTRSKRDIHNGRATEISRLIGRTLRACVDLALLNGFQITIDCDVIQADGGTRTASITGGFIALFDAITHLQHAHKITGNPIKYFIAAVSVGIIKDEQLQNNLLLDLDYQEDSNCETDATIVMASVINYDKSDIYINKLELSTNHDLNDISIIEVQANAERSAFSVTTFNQLIDLAKHGISDLIQMQQQLLNN